MSDEGLKTTPNKLIHIGSPIPFDADEFLSMLQELMLVAYNGDEDHMRKLVMDAVGTYRPAGEHGSEYKGEVYEKQLATVAS